MSNSKKPLNKKKYVARNWEKHQFHLVDSSQLPFLTAMSTMLIVLSLVFYWHPSNVEKVVMLDAIIMHFAFIMFTFTIMSWFIMIVRESQAGHHTAIVQQGLRLGVILFIASEVMFFFAFFWAFFHYSLSPSVFIGCVWPPKGIQPIDVWGLPLTNTLLLLSSGVTITIAHRYIVKAQHTYAHKAFAKYLFATIILGVVFLLCQGIEYKYGLTFSWKENVYGSIFFILTGFHGFHVTLGTFALWFCLVRALLTRAGPRFIKNGRITTFYKVCVWIYSKLILPFVATALFKKLSKIFMPFDEEGFSIEKNKLDCVNKTSTASVKTFAEQELITFHIWLRSFGFTPKQHIGFEAAAWYWHFVDVVWLFLFITVYWWGN